MFWRLFRVFVRFWGVSSGVSLVFFVVSLGGSLRLVWGLFRVFVEFLEGVLKGFRRVLQGL